ncbi:MAG TPA: ABC transporter permease [Noviherbaspirillum sp.]|nr:ABC transporter permease [Noviherbaspirillum sp.]
MNTQLSSASSQPWSRLPRLQQMTSLNAQALSGPMACMLMIAVMASISPGFVSANNFGNIFSQSSVLFVLAIGQMFVILIRGFDISVGAVAALASVVAVQAMPHVGESAAIMLGIMTGLLAGALNGYLIACHGLQPIVVTLGTTLVVRGAATALEEAADSMSLGGDGMLQLLGYAAFLGLPLLVWLAAIISLSAWLITRWLPFGRWLYMVGGNPEAARLVGVPVRSTETLAYALCGACAGLAGMFLLARSGTAIATEGAGMELQAIAACVIGGIALGGGRGSVWQALAGALFIQALLNGLNLLGSSPFVSEMVLGAVIVSAGILDYVVRKFKRD